MEPQPLPPPDPAPSLADRLGSAIADRGAAAPPPADARRLGIMLAVLLPLGPALTLAGAEAMAAWTRAAAAETASGAAAVRADRAAAERRELAGLGTASLAQTLDAMARALPVEDRLVSLARAEDAGGVAAEVATTDPDRLRAAIARNPATARLRSTGERSGDGVLIVTLEAAP
jgi:hypothetical protein